MFSFCVQFSCEGAILIHACGSRLTWSRDPRRDYLLILSSMPLKKTFIFPFSRLCYDLSKVLSEVLGMGRWYEKYGILGLCEKMVQGMHDMLLCF